MTAIRAVKSGALDGRTTALLSRAAQRLIEQGAQAVIAGCTEIPLGLPANALRVPLIDPALLRRRRTRRATGRTRARPRRALPPLAVPSAEASREPAPVVVRDRYLAGDDLLLDFGGRRVLAAQDEA
ncbi:aspartate/glutamate racemase family protein [Streptomyces mayteni]